jgi:hypothetical protein
MSLPIHRQTSLPRRFPVGAKYVVEGFGADESGFRVIARYVILPGGRRINVPPGPPVPAPSRVLPFRRAAAKSALSKPARSKNRVHADGKKIAVRRGTG